jgi:hypothetical protein
MKRVIAYVIVLASIFYLSSCTRSLSPYEAAHGSYRKCARIR